jgi:uncharacterized protein (TIGR00730 family)
MEGYLKREEKMNLFIEILRAMGVTFHAGFQKIKGIYYLSRLKQPTVAIFGGKGAYEEGKYAQWAQQVGRICVEKNMSVITGGGPGIMEAANCGAAQAGKNAKQWTLGIGVRGVDVEFENRCAPVITVDYFFVRKWLLTHYAAGFILFPGGIGTLDEFFEVLNLIKLHKMKKVPIVLVGSSYWKNLINWFEHAFEYEFVAEAPHTFFVVTDDLQEAVCIIERVCRPKS